MKEDVFWPKMATCLKKYFRNCRGCVLGVGFGKRVSNLKIFCRSGTLVKCQGNSQILVVIYAFSKYCSLRPIKAKTAEHTIRALLKVFDKLGKPKHIIADRATTFTSTMFRNFLTEHSIQLHHVVTGMPRGNG